MVSFAMGLLPAVQRGGTDSSTSRWLVYRGAQAGWEHMLRVVRWFGAQGKSELS